MRAMSMQDACGHGEGARGTHLSNMYKLKMVMVPVYDPGRCSWTESDGGCDAKKTVDNGE